jgi:MoxR-like ATPase
MSSPKPMRKPKLPPPIDYLPDNWQPNVRPETEHTETPSVPRDGASQIELALKALINEVAGLRDNQSSMDELTVRKIVTDQLQAERVEFGPEAIAKIVEDVLAHYPATKVEMTLDDVKVELPDTFHETLPLVIQHLTAGLHVFMPGPAGSGKSTIAMQAAEAMKMPFGSLSLGPTTPTSKLFGYMNATGEYVGTEFRRVYEGGGIFLVDEMDNGHPGLLAELNQALANPQAAFADRMVDRHETFRMAATGNTFGRGPDRLFVGRNVLDAATLDRFATIEILIDERLERRVASAWAKDDNRVEDWINYVQSVRRRVTDNRLAVVVSPRATIDGAKLLSIGVPWDTVKETRLFAGVGIDIRMKVEN